MWWEGAYVVAAHLLILVELRALLVDTRAEVGRIATEGDVKVLEELVAAGQERLGLVGVGIDTRLAIEDNDAVGKVSGHDEIVLDNEGGLLGVHDETLDDARGNDTLLRVEVGRGLVNEIDVGGHTERENDGNTLQFTTGQILDLLVDEVIELQGLDDISLELRRQERLLDLLEEQLADSALKLGSDGLRLHADLHLGYICLGVRLKGTSEQATESGLASSVLSHHDDDFGVGKLAAINAEPEVTQVLLHAGVLEGTRPVDGELIAGISNAESERLLTETQVLSGDVTIKEDVDTLTNRVRQSDDTINGRLAVENADVIGQVVKD